MPTPSIAFLVPSKNRQPVLARYVPSVVAAAQRIGARVVVCDQSDQPWPEPAEGIDYHYQPILLGLPAARNRLLRLTSADVVVFLDDDTELDPAFGCRLRELVAAEPRISAWGPVIETRSPLVRALHRLAHQGVFKDPRRLLRGPTDRRTRALFGCCFAVRRQSALAIGFDERRSGYALGEDLDFCWRLTEAGHAARFAKALRARHHEVTAQRADAFTRGVAKARFLVWWARRHGRARPGTLPQLALALAAAASGLGREPASILGIVYGLSG